MTKAWTARVPETRSRLGVRSATAADARSIAALSEVLGYPLTLRTARERLILLRGAEHEVAIATRPPHGVVGWVEVRVEESLTSGRRCRVLGVVVAPDARRSGVGAALLEWAEGWARRRGCRELYLTSNAARKEAQAFYPACGWSHRKTSHVYFRSTGRTNPGRV